MCILVYELKSVGEEFALPVIHALFFAHSVDGLGINKTVKIIFDRPIQTKMLSL